MVRTRAFAVLGALLAGGWTALGSPYWIAWDGEGETAGMPEEFGWTRNWGNWDGQFQGPGAYRTLENGILTYDSLYDPGVFDYNYMERPGQLDPEEPNECFVLEWRLKVSQVVGYYDPGIGVHSDEAWAVGFSYAYDHIWSNFENANIPFEPGLFHDYRLVSGGMRDYQLFIDGTLAREGQFLHKFSESYVGWGDDWQGFASLHQWDYVRFGCVSAPVPGDVNCDGAVNFGDINPFVEALSDPDGYQQSYPGCWPSNADINGDGSVNFGDIDPFVALLAS
jgi:hypothetical protein